MFSHVLSAAAILRGAGVRVLRARFVGAAQNQVSQRALRLNVRSRASRARGEKLRHHRARRAAALFDIADHPPAQAQRLVGMT